MSDCVLNIVNPFLLMANEDMYAYLDWSAVRSFNFTVELIIHACMSSNFIHSLIILISLPLFILFKGNEVRSTLSNLKVPHSKSYADQTRGKSFEKYLIFLPVTLIYHHSK